MADPRWLTDRQLKTWQAFLAVSAQLNRRVEQQLRDDAGLSHPQYEVLARLAAAGGALRMTELAGAALTSKSGLSYQVGQLEKTGLVGRRSCESDDRGVIAFLTDLGWSQLREAAAGHAALVGELLVDALTTEQFGAFSTVLDTLESRLRGADRPQRTAV
ncbi:MarR family winged helix-turn-helix transcriptional regulator [Amycolatopsis carbonis]|uniref:MarR family winged helix-turn-helix transcriptional regulator n=1 Tax=Amycolatopsis carbonis TaxID=715471 RepID=A0A9Y2IAL5_9PSEU|nr:MarR family winged helix-turn-helix transcriptional regulator [Amycolatopsis sp. 2-15]WIX75751.1 MarR family winged helix-turn-helix transcriptional regulator [Amycolatopsis sp. 2-15]